MQNLWLTCFSFQSLNILFYCHLASMIFDGNRFVILREYLCFSMMVQSAFLLLLSKFLPSLSFSSLRIIYHDVDFFEFVLLEFVEVLVLSRFSHSDSLVTLCLWLSSPLSVGSSLVKDTGVWSCYLLSPVEVLGWLYFLCIS